MAASSLGKARRRYFKEQLAPSLLQYWHSRTWQPIMALYTLQVLYNCVDKLRLRWRGQTLNPEEPRQQQGSWLSPGQVEGGAGWGQTSAPHYNLQSDLLTPFLYNDSVS